MPRRDEPLAARLRRFGNSIFGEMSALAATTGAINLGQGFPDTDGPRSIVDAAIIAAHEGNNQYPPAIGHADLRLAIAEHQDRFYGLVHDPDTEVLVTAGATEALAAAIMALCEAGDEIVVFEPCYDSYGPCAAIVGARLRPVTLRPDPATGKFAFDPDELRRAFTGHTRLVLLNNPHNPTGKVFTVDELRLIAELCVAHDVIAVTDEVYEHLTFTLTHIPLAMLPGMDERTLTISSAGKTFSFTGWKIGWAVGPAPLVQAVRTVKQFLTYVNGAPFQPAIALALRLDDAYYMGIAVDLERKRDLLAAGLREGGLTVYEPDGTYFVVADIAPITGDDAVTYCRALPERVGVVAIPASVFYETPGEGSTLVRFAFCKRDEVLAEAVERLRVIRL